MFPQFLLWLNNQHADWPLKHMSFYSCIPTIQDGKAWTSVIHCACHHLKPLFKCLSHILMR